MGSAAAKSVVIMYLHLSSEISKKKRDFSKMTRAGDSSLCHLPAVYRFSRCFYVSVFTCPSVIVDGWCGSHIPNKKILLVSLSRLVHTL